VSNVPCRGLLVHDERPTRLIAGLRVADLADIQAMKLRAVYARGELRDYFDLMTLDTDYPTEIGIGLFLEKFGAEGNAAFDDRASVVQAIVRSLGYLDDVDDDPGLPVTRATIERFWRRRQPQVAREMDRFGR
jgi:Nucleotidyl transferase AbiEii toxin, Type IV TA system